MGPRWVPVTGRQVGRTHLVYILCSPSAGWAGCPRIFAKMAQGRAGLSFLKARRHVSFSICSHACAGMCVPGENVCVPVRHRWVAVCVEQGSPCWECLPVYNETHTEGTGNPGPCQMSKAREADLCHLLTQRVCTGSSPEPLPMEVALFPDSVSELSWS